MRKNKFIIPILGMTAGVAAITPTLVSCGEETKKAPEITLDGPKTTEIADGEKIKFNGKVTGDFELYNYFGLDMCTVVIAPYTLGTDMELPVICEDIILDSAVQPCLAVVTKDGKFDFEISLSDSAAIPGKKVEFQLWVYLQTKNDLIKFEFKTYEYTCKGE